MFPLSVRHVVDCQAVLFMARMATGAKELTVATSKVLNAEEPEEDFIDDWIIRIPRCLCKNNLLSSRVVKSLELHRLWSTNVDF